MTKYLFTFFLLISIHCYSQPNCNVYKMNDDQACYKACLIATDGGYTQGSRASQANFDRAIALCPSLDYAYREKSVPYLKRGDFITWRKLIDKAVELNPTLHLGARGWCRFQFIRDYKGAIEDFERLESMTKYDIGYSVNGDYHLNIAKALCYKGIGNRKKAIEIIETQLAIKEYIPLKYDYLHLGVLKMENGDLEGGIECLKKSISANGYLAEPYYYLGLIYKKQNLTKEFKECMVKAKTHYLNGYTLFDPYTHPMDKVYLTDIEKHLKSVD